MRLKTFPDVMSVLMITIGAMMGLFASSLLFLDLRAMKEGEVDAGLASFLIFFLPPLVRA